MNRAAAICLLLAACSEDEPGLPIRAAGTEPERPSDDQVPAPRFRFVDATSSSGLAGFEQVSGVESKDLILGSVGGGVALADVDLDGDLDAYLTNGSFVGVDPTAAPRDALYLNDGTGRFTDVTEKSGLGDDGWTTGVRIVDYDADEWPDIYLTNYGPNVLYRNQGDGTFVDVTAETGVGDPGWSTGACFFDMDRDGDLDLYVANYVAVDEDLLRERPTVSYKGIEVMKGPRGLQQAFDTLYRNDGGVFVDVSEEYGVRSQARFGFQCIAFDMDRDGWLDVYVANDSVDNTLWKNLEGKGFEDVAGLHGLAVSMAGQPQAGMGLTLGDFDGDLIEDVFVTNFSDDYFTLYRGTTRNFFVDVTHRMRLVESTRASLGWACGFEDFDSSGDLEIYVGNGHVYPQVDEIDVGAAYRQRNQLFALEGGKYREVDAGPGFADLRATRGGAVGDIDGDGDLDILFGNLDDRPMLLANESPQHHALRVDIVGSGRDRGAVGTRVVVRVGEQAQLRLAGLATGFLSSSEPTLHFGLGDAELVDSLEVTWPTGRIETFVDIAANQRVRITAGSDPDGSSKLELGPLAGK